MSQSLSYCSLLAKSFKDVPERQRRCGSAFKRLLGSCLLVYFTSYIYETSHFNRPFAEVRTNYLHWSSGLPAMSVCQAAPSQHQLSNVEGFLENLERPVKQYCRNCLNVTEFPVKDFRKIVAKRASRCNRLLENCSWNGQRLDCCSAFKYLPTKLGPCLSINSELTGSRFKLEVSHYSRQAVLSFSSRKDIQVYIHDPKDIDLGWEERTRCIRGGEALEVLYRARQAVAEESARWTSRDARRCVLAGELVGYPLYSQSICRLNCLAREQQASCGCIHHLLSTTVRAPDCDLQGLLCLNKKFRKKVERKLIEKCDCLPSCEEIEINLVWSHISRANDSLRKVTLSLTTPPTEKIVLRGKFELLDILVAFACFSRVFTSKSLYDILSGVYLYKNKNIVSCVHK